ncbi:bifunctional diaminohydroxyphosphoribosylaminopyrimidine deaminase/5-amino-6-(5-phosphoribosylamino)uracil reductase RibD [Alteromonas sp. ASW11-130]|uniref:bifunctional diaminohydroxyphosphoribosylaminopyrimidine deaminase/5-amino-6-(5-phosphoribosylamino)uracil reductase RibD n=1 Tax=Alteromonas sp. ASW11-130 TaxID=3015775 RepID=UPI002241CFC9|nr:bifunctional diaminohydroxyphosphoribosylaminopyrimidine deaminase/5-amino-6-(5-phosphoribosylamino)uracil reductase RibD [Alteromonas sp. ASW11-130]MCW8093007.1 bifunctional diaminohydroxyphosphoribosylaminopyrimidine deaminase/5-amino-6-(5-phosphoribosylamino)uracil reductase RibD [Alteromonas sp. ASW11-130]
MTLASKPTTSNDYRWMGEAIKLARKGKYTTTPNPNVGCVIVDSNQNLVGKGYHLQAGTSHAEVHALRQAGQKASGGTAYVTLEPCSHFGRTPPCADALIDAGVKRVVVAMTDPNPQVSGKGIAKIQQAGIEVVVGVMAAEAANLNRGFIKRMTYGKPFVTLKLAISLDGKIALSNGKSKWITSPEARSDVHRHRAESSAILTGSGTALHDNPSLLVRQDEANLTDYPLPEVRQPLRVVVDSKGGLPANLQLFNDGHASLVATTHVYKDCDHAETVVVTGERGKVSLTALMDILGQRQINDVWVEAGPGLAGALLQSGLVDELIVYQAPIILGDKATSMLTLPDFSEIDQAYSLTLRQLRHVGVDTKMTFSINAKPFSE